MFQWALLKIFVQHIITILICCSLADLFSEESKMDSLMIKQEPKCEEDFEDYFCEEEMKVCFV